MTVPTDWDAIESLYRAGQVSNRVLAEKYGVSEGAIRKKAKAQGWVKDLSDQVRQAVRSELVRTEVRTSHAGDREIIEVAAATGAQVVRTHRKDIRSAADLVGLMLQQLTEAVIDRESIENTIEAETADDETGHRRAKMMRAVSLGGHAAIMRDLSTAAKNLVSLERQAYNLDETSAEESYEDRLARLMGG
ncbi:MAG: hypothetical protein K2Y25_09270 [Pseudomonadaceae bacterium]|nr:hypothetical protein [Pseudomonadaceae bacterium]